jgi:hypothetical protein
MTYPYSSRLCKGGQERSATKRREERRYSPVLELAQDKAAFCFFMASDNGLLLDYFSSTKV